MTFALLSALERPERSPKDGRVIAAYTELLFFKKMMMLGGAPFAIELTGKVREARQFDTRAVAKREAERIGRRYYRVAKVAVPA